MILEDIVESTKERVETNKKRHSIYELKEKAFAMTKVFLLKKL